MDKKKLETQSDTFLSFFQIWYHGMDIDMTAICYCENINISHSNFLSPIYK